MGYEEEDYASVPAAINGSMSALARAARDREESSIGLAKLNAKKEGKTRMTDRGAEKAEQEEEEGEMILTIKQTKVLKTYEQRRKFIVKAMDLHRHTIGGGRSGRRGRAECTSFFRRALEILDDQYEEALRAEGAGNDEDTGPMGQYTKSEDYGSAEEDESSEEEKEEEEEDEEDEVDGDEEEEAKEEIDAEVKPKKEPKRKGPGRPRKSEILEKAASPNKTNKLKVENPKLKVVVNEQDFFDQHNDLCEVCNKPGEVLCCATCNLVYHVNCLRPKLKGDPPDDWSCAYCISDGVLGGKKDGKDRRKAAQACREMEQMRRDVKEREQTMVAGGINMNEAKADGDKRPAAIDTSGDGGVGYDGVRATLEDAAESGCRKCVKELETGIKTRKEHDDICPRKFKSVGKPGNFSPRFAAPSALARVKQEEEVEDDDEEEVAEDDIKEKNMLDYDGMVSLEVAAVAGCIKCQQQFKTGEMTRKVHADDCPRKYRGAFTGACSISPVPQGAATAKKSEEVTIDAEEPPVKRRKVGRPPAKKPGRPPAPATDDHPTSSPIEDHPLSLEGGAAAGCDKCSKELETGEKTRNGHSSECPLKWRGGRPPPGIPRPASTDAIKARQQQKLVVEEFKGKVAALPCRSARLPRTSPPDETEVSPFVTDMAAAAMPRRGRPTKASLDSANHTAVPLKPKPFAKRGPGRPAFGAESTDAETPRPRRGKRTRLDSTSAYLDEDAAMEDEEEEEESAAILGEFAEETAKQHEGNKYGDGEQLAKTLRGGGEISDASMKLDWSEEAVTANVPTSSVVEWAPIKSESAVAMSATNRELEDLAVHSMLGYEMSDLTYSNNGRVQRSCKKPSLFTPHYVPDSSWTSDGDNTAKAATGKECGELEHMRGGGRPKKDTTTSPAQNTPAIIAPKRGRPPTKQTKGGGSPKMNKKRAPIKKETNTSVEGVGILNRKPSTLFDCPACLDLSKIKICCYCACRICFNKFGKEQMMLCDTCDQEYHTFCLGLDCIPEGGWECPACSEYEEKKAMMEQKKKVCTLTCSTREMIETLLRFLFQLLTGARGQEKA